MLLSLVILYFGAEGLVSGAASLAKRIGISPLVIGLTIVSVGTSAPELLVSVKAALNGQGALSVGNVLGSNFFNVGIILGISAIIYPLAVKRQLLKLDVPVMVLSSLLFFLFFLDFTISALEATIFLLILITYITYMLRSSRKEKATQKGDEEDEIKMSKHWLLDILFIGVGLAALVYGSDLLVVNAVIIAGWLGMSEALIGLTIVAAGTSMPELATSVVAALKKRSDIAIGNVVGSNIFNILLILGVAGLIAPLNAPDINYVDGLFNLGIGVLLWLFMKRSSRIKRVQGAVFLLFYLIYFTYKLFLI